MIEKFKGIIPYLVSPINQDGSVRSEELQKLIEYLIRKGVHGLTVLGSAGEFPLLEKQQKESIVNIAISCCAGRVPVIAGVSGASVMQVCDSARTFVKNGVQGLVVMLDMYYPLSSQQIANFYIALAKEVPETPIVIYSNPKYMHFEIPLDVFDKLLPYENIMYYKDASGNTGNLLSFKKRFGDRYGIFSASAHVPLFVMMMGGLGWMSGPACLFPEQSIKLYELALAGDYSKAMELQETLWEANRVFKKYDMAACLKCGLAHQGFAVGEPVAPLEGLTGKAAEEVHEIVDRLFKKDS